MRRRPAARLARLCLFGALLGAAFATGCRPRSESQLRIGVKGFVEQRVVAAAVRELARQAEIDVGQTRECGDTHGCWSALAGDRVDALIEYTGTALSYRGLPVGPKGESDEAQLARIRAVDRPRGLRWLVPLGFDNGYRLLVAPARANVQRLRSIADLARIDGGVRVACPQTYLSRPRDGLSALLARHGLKLAMPPLTIDDTAKRLRALHSGRVDVVVAYATDGALREQPLTVLRDTLGFFPPYRAALVVREATLARMPSLEQVLRRLKGRLDERRVRQANHAVAVDRRPTEQVGRELLRSTGLMRPAQRTRKLQELLLARAPADQLEGHTPAALRAVQQVFSGRPTRVLATADPLRKLRRGEAQLALVGAERLFSRGSRGDLRLSRDARVAGVVTRRLIHLLRRRDDARADALAGKLGIPTAQSSAGSLLGELLERAKRQAAQRGSTQQLIAQLRSKQLDAVLLLAAAGDKPLVELLGGARASTTDLALHPLPRLPQRDAFPFLRPGRIPARSYPGQPRPLETLAAQLVLVGPAPGRQIDGVGGPAEALRNRGRPLSRVEERKLIAALGIGGTPDPLLIGPPGQALAADPPAKSTAKALIRRLLNLFAFAFLGWLMLIVTRGR
jgi:glycine betaine/choline ABC-type transport system substrate-binding protein